MDNCRDILDELAYEGIYRDNGIAVFKGSKTTGKVQVGLAFFKKELTISLAEN